VDAPGRPRCFCFWTRLLLLLIQVFFLSFVCALAIALHVLLVRLLLLLIQAFRLCVYTYATSKQFVVDSRFLKIKYAFRCVQEQELG
jgi:hypothetical protein